jgi:hypothetical protein
MDACAKKETAEITVIIAHVKELKFLVHLLATQTDNAITQLDFNFYSRLHIISFCNSA